MGVILLDKIKVHELAKKMNAQKNKYEEALKRHQTLLDNLIREKEALSNKCENLLKRVTVAREEATRREKEVHEQASAQIAQQRELAIAQEKARQKKILEQKTKEIKEATVRGLEPEIQNLIAKQKKEIEQLKKEYDEQVKITKEQCEKRNDEERGLSSPRKKIEKSNEEDRTLNSPRNKDTKLNSPRYKSEQAIRLPKKVESPKDDEERELLSPRNRAESLRTINKNELNYDDEDDPVLNSPRYKPPAFNETNIALDRFNGLPLKFQKTFISELIKKSPNKLNQDLNLIKELLRYLLQFNQSINSIHYFSVSTNRPKESYANVNEWCQDINEVHLLSAATEILYLNNSLDFSR